ncbi:YceI family protein [Nitrogeniibacter mangrovi]|uniref:YceI family protein n=1 Tax=Nitrogeniibacter mangrovi TaxID=2016596 RepID=A0A6C1AY42_9RHOO|nr:YceI family protein [Nitrogeniibacter mangrovi]QID16281.1 YceI family protein [Nitrogeniibacter mangrovi]
MADTPVWRCGRWVASLLVLAVAACGVSPEMRVAPEPPSRPLASAPADAARYAVDAARTRIRFIVRRAGTLARLGHNHVIIARQVTGVVALAPALRRSTVSLRLPVAGFEVDPPEARAALGEGFEPVPDAAVAGTRRNMLGERVLDATRYPAVRVDTVAVEPGPDAVHLTVRITLRGVSRDLRVPVDFVRQGDTLEARAQFEIRQTDFGMTPLAVLGGALQVADAVTVRLHLVAVRRP